MSYLPSGTQFAISVPSYFSPGELNNGADFVAMNVNTTGSTGPLVGVSGAFTATVSTSLVNHWLTAQTGITYLIASGSNGNPSSTTPKEFRVIDTGGGSAANNIKISGNAGVTINGSTAAITLNTNYGNKNFLQASGNAWFVL